MEEEIEHILASAFQDGFGAARDPKYRNRTVEHTKRIMQLIMRDRIDELNHIAPDMRTHPEYKGYVETSASGKWQPLSDRIKELEKEQK